MPQLTANPSVGDTVTDSGWQYRWTGDRWVSDGFTQQFNPFAGFEGPLAAAITDPTLINYNGSSPRFDLVPWARGASGQTNIFTNTDEATIGAWVVHEFITNLNSVSSRELYMVLPRALTDSPVSGVTDTSALAPSADGFSSWDVFNGDTSIRTASAAQQRFDSVWQTAQNATGGPANASTWAIDDGSFTSPENLVDADRVTFTLTSGTDELSANLINTAYRGDSFDLRRGPLLSTGYYFASSLSGGGSITDTDGLARSRVSIYSLYLQRTDNP